MKSRKSEIFYGSIEMRLKSAFRCFTMYLSHITKIYYL